MFNIRKLLNQGSGSTPSQSGFDLKLLVGNNVVTPSSLGITDTIDDYTDFITCNDASMPCNYFIIKGKLYYFDYDGDNSAYRVRQVGTSNQWTKVSYNTVGGTGTDTYTYGVCNKVLYALQEATATAVTLSDSATYDSWQFVSGYSEEDTTTSTAEIRKYAYAVGANQSGTISEDDQTPVYNGTHYFYSLLGTNGTYFGNISQPRQYAGMSQTSTNSTTSTPTVTNQNFAFSRDATFKEYVCNTTSYSLNNTTGLQAIFAWTNNAYATKVTWSESSTNSYIYYLNSTATETQVGGTDWGRVNAGCFVHSTYPMVTIAMLQDGTIKALYGSSIVSTHGIATTCTGCASFKGYGYSTNGNTVTSYTIANASSTTITTSSINLADVIALYGQSYYDSSVNMYSPAYALIYHEG